ncbi:ATP synthase F0 subcomplex subunit H atp14 [Rhizina undulata]
MLAQSLRVSRTTLLRSVARQQARTFIVPTAVRQVDIVTEIYLRELKNYKPAPTKLSDAEGQVKTFSPPAPPRVPKFGESILAEELKAYESQEVEIEGQVAEGEAVEAKEEDWFEEDATFTEEGKHH